jgi:hypothetical protein
VGILKTAATVAVASSVHGRIQRRQQQRRAAQDQAAGMSERLAQLSTLSDLKSAGVLTDTEFDEQKARILNG